MHINRRLPLEAFNNKHIRRLIDSGRQLFKQWVTRERRPLLKALVLQLSSCLIPPQARGLSHRPPQPLINNVNFVAAYQVAFASFIRVEEFTYNTANRKDNKTFAAIKLTRGNIRFTANHARLTLKYSKTDKAHKGVNIILTRSRDSAYLIKALEALFTLDPHKLGQPLFRFKRAIFN